MKLPDLLNYRDGFIKEGVSFPLRPVAVPAEGLLGILPAPPAGKDGWPWSTETSPSVYEKGKYWPKITIVTPSFNQGRFIEQTIRSVLLQNYPNLEYIVMDGGSTDGTKDILTKYEPWISLWRSKQDGGQGQAINQGFSLGSGAYFAWINSDDHYLKGVFHTVASTFSRTKAKFVYGYVFNYYVSEQRFELNRILPFLDIFIKIPGLAQPATFWKAEIHQPIWEELHCSLDFELWLRLVKGNKRHLIRHPLAVANVHGDAKTVDPEMKRKWQEDHMKIWSDDGHGEVFEWKRISFLNRVRIKLYKIFRMI